VTGRNCERGDEDVMHEQNHVAIHIAAEVIIREV
jgi:hypothetical protein